MLKETLWTGFRYPRNAMLKVTNVLQAEHGKVALFNHWKIVVENSKHTSKVWMTVRICLCYLRVYCLVKADRLIHRLRSTVKCFYVFLVAEICVEGPAGKPVTAIVGSVTSN
jgi:hypothetical protein